MRRFAYQENQRASDCYLSGSMKCVDCHDPHSQGYRDVTGAPLAGPLADRQCTGCHAAKAEPAGAHAHHRADSPGSRCVACHMPYLQEPEIGRTLRYARADHTVAIPRPGFDDSLGVGSACRSCHGDKPVVYFLTVSPHREPTHTHFDKDWNQLPPRNSNMKPTWQGKPAYSLDNRAM